MTSRGKKIFIALSVIIPFLIYCGIYYQEKFRYANFKAKDFVSFEYKWGVNPKLENSYNSLTGEYRYHDRDDSLIVKNVKLTAKDFKYLDSVADLQGFWNLPDIVANSEKDLQNPTILRYEMKFTYKNADKTVLYLTNYDRNPRMKDAVAHVQKEIMATIADADN